MLTLQDDELMHYGVLGMKWGVRHDTPRSGAGKHKSKHTTSRVTKSSANRKGNFATQNMVWQQQQQAITDANRAMSIAVTTSIPGMGPTPFMFGGKNETKEERAARHKEAAKKVAKIALGVAATAAVSFAAYKVATNPKFKQVIQKQVINKSTAKDLAEVIATSGPEIVKKSSNKSPAIPKTTKPPAVPKTKAVSNAKKSSPMQFDYANAYAKEQNRKAIDRDIDRQLKAVRQATASASRAVNKTTASQIANNQALINEYYKRRR